MLIDTRYENNKTIVTFRAENKEAQEQAGAFTDAQLASAAANQHQLIWQRSSSGRVRITPKSTESPPRAFNIIREPDLVTITLDFIA